MFGDENHMAHASVLGCEHPFVGGDFLGRVFLRWHRTVRPFEIGEGVDTEVNEHAIAPITHLRLLHHRGLRARQAGEKSRRRVLGKAAVSKGNLSAAVTGLQEAYAGQ